MTPSTSCSNSTIITEKILARVRQFSPFEKTNGVPIENALKVLEELGLDVTLARADLIAVKDRARYHYTTASASIADQYFLERVILMGICDISNRGNLGLFELSFPHIDHCTSPKFPPQS